MKNLLILTGILIFYASAAQSTTNSEVSKQPNIIFILTDDMGYGDLGVLHQNKRAAAGKPAHKTPHLDKLAGEGMLLTRHYVPAPVCAPSRASLLLGVHQGHSNVRNNQFDKALEDNHTIASVLKEAGYATGIVGKYGLQGKEGNNPQTWEAYPTKRGFDFFFGYVRHVDGHNHYPAHEARQRPPMELYYGNEEISGQLEGCYTTDLFTAAAKKWITDLKESDSEKPFFLYLAYDTPHAGLEVANAPYPEGGGIKGGVQWIGESGNFINTAGDTIDSYIHPDYAVEDWPIGPKRFASMMRRIDNGVGDLKQLLKDLDMDENTLVVFSSDNGPHNVSYDYGEYAPTFFDNFGELDGIKRDLWEGGIRVPTIAWWPGKISPSQQNSQPAQFHDWMPTFAELAGIPAPARTDGISLLPRLWGNRESEPGTVYVEYEVQGTTPDYPEFHSSHAGQIKQQMQVIFLDGLKGVRYNIQSHDDNFRIYDTEKDSREINNLDNTNEYFVRLQQRMKDEVLRVRRPNETAARPYDGVPVPQVITVGLQQGLKFRIWNVKSPWAPAVNGLDEAPGRTGIARGFKIPGTKINNENVTAFEGFIDVPATGNYTFHLKVNGKAIMRLHKALLMDADKNYQSGSEITTDIKLEKGMHPFSFIFAGQSAPDIQLEWSGPSFARQPVDVERMHYRN